MDTSIQAAAIGSITTLIAALIGFGAITWQIAHQARTAMKQRAYEQIVQICEQASDAEIEFSNFIRQLLLELEAYAKTGRQPEDIRRMGSRVPRMIELQARQADALISAVRVVERWLIIDPRIDLFKLAFNISFHEIYWTFFRDFFPIVSGKMPAETLHPETGTVLHSPEACTEAQLREIKSVGEQLLSKLNDFTAYLHDFQVEMQNLLLRGLFKHRVPNRQPIDPNAIVLTLEDHTVLEKRLYEETEGGRYLKRIENETRQKPTTSS